jgi:hypothetical protein
MWRAHRLRRSTRTCGRRQLEDTLSRRGWLRVPCCVASADFAQGLPTVLLGITAMFVLPDRPEVTKFLNDKERILALERRNRFSRGDIGATVNRRECF